MKSLRVVVNNFKLCEISFIPEGNKTLEDKGFELQEIDDNLFTYVIYSLISGADLVVDELKKSLS